jgi:hypothetical protein
VLFFGWHEKSMKKRGSFSAPGWASVVEVSDSFAVRLMVQVGREMTDLRECSTSVEEL